MSCSCWNIDQYNSAAARVNGLYIMFCSFTLLNDIDVEIAHLLLSAISLPVPLKGEVGEQKIERRKTTF
jgi:hypothetical protein